MGVPEPYYSDEAVTLYHGKCETVLPSLPGASIDACVTDPPYGLSELPRKQVEKALAAWLSGDRLHVPDGRGFMGAEWDKFVPPPGVWDEVYRVLKPGAYLMAFAAPRTYDLMGLSIRLAGFEVQDSIDWIFGQGFPKSRGRLKPAHEPMVLAWKPAKNATEFPGLEACRVPGIPEPTRFDPARHSHDGWRHNTTGAETAERASDAGRWPPNIVLTHSASCEPMGTRRVRGDSRSGQPRGQRPGGFGNVGADRGDERPNGALHGDQVAETWDCAPGCPVAELDRQSGVLTSGVGAVKRASAKGGARSASIGAESRAEGTEMICYGDTGGASRFFPVFHYEAKAPSSERPRLADGTAWSTVKPLGFMRWAARLVVPQDGTCLDPFGGTFTTPEACIIEGFRCVAIERDEAALRLGMQRLSKPIQPVMFGLEAS